MSQIDFCFGTFAPRRDVRRGRVLQSSGDVLPCV